MDNTYVQLKMDTKIRSIDDVKDKKEERISNVRGIYITGYDQIYEVIYFCTRELYEKCIQE